MIIPYGGVDTNAIIIVYIIQVLVNANYKFTSYHEYDQKIVSEISIANIDLESLSVLKINRS